MIGEDGLDRLARLIAAHGPLRVDQFMAAAAYGEAGTYRDQDPIGASGHFVTAPEISQIFGELLGVWVVAQWIAMGRPARFFVIEMGPGRGSLMADACRVFAQAPEFCAAAAIVLVEPSPVLQARQRAVLANAPIPVAHAPDLCAIAAGPAALLANEVLDCWPIRQFVQTPEGLRERLVGLDDAGRPQFGLADWAPQAIGPLPAHWRAAPIGAVLELRPQDAEFVAAIAARAAQAPMIALCVDYGAMESGIGDSLQGLVRHQKCSPLAAFGTGDITAHVDFAHVSGLAAAAGLQVAGPFTQRALLLGLGGAARLAALELAAPEAAGGLQAGFARLIDPNGMGGLFKALILGGAPAQNA